MGCVLPPLVIFIFIRITHERVEEKKRKRFDIIAGIHEVLSTTKFKKISTIICRNFKTKLLNLLLILNKIWNP